MSYGMDYQGGGDFGGGGGGGGGFTSTSGGGGFGSQQTPSSKQRSRRSYDEQTLIPVTLKMALQAKTEDGDTQILEDGRTLTLIKVVGAVRSFEDNSTNAVYALEDGTGLMDVKQWIDETDSTAASELQKQTFQDNIYVKVIGTIKEYDGKKQIVANAVRPLSTANQIAHHFLEVVHSAESYKRADQIVANPQASFLQPTGTPLSAVKPSLGGGDLGGGSSELKDHISQYLLTHVDPSDEERGASIVGCIAQLTSAGRYTETQIRHAVEEMGNDGLLYSTVDDDHYKMISS